MSKEQRMAGMVLIAFCMVGFDEHGWQSKQGGGSSAQADISTSASRSGVVPASAESNWPDLSGGQQQSFRESARSSVRNLGESVLGRVDDAVSGVEAAGRRAIDRLAPNGTVGASQTATGRGATGRGATVRGATGSNWNDLESTFDTPANSNRNSPTNATAPPKADGVTSRIRRVTEGDTAPIPPRRSTGNVISQRNQQSLAPRQPSGTRSTVTTRSQQQPTLGRSPIAASPRIRDDVPPGENLADWLNQGQQRGRSAVERTVDRVNEEVSSFWDNLTETVNPNQSVAPRRRSPRAVSGPARQSNQRTGDAWPSDLQLPGVVAGDIRTNENRRRELWEDQPQLRRKDANETFEPAPEPPHDFVRRMEQIRRDTVESRRRELMDQELQYVSRDDPRQRRRDATDRRDYVPPMDRETTVGRSVVPVPRNQEPISGAQSAVDLPQRSSEDYPRTANDRFGQPTAGDIDPSTNRDRTQGVREALSDRPWWPLLLAVLGLFGSISFNVYLGWIAWDLYSRYQEAIDDVQDLEQRLETKSKEVALSI